MCSAIAKALWIPRERIAGSGGREHQTRAGVRDRLGHQRLLIGEVVQPVDALGQPLWFNRRLHVQAVAHLCLIFS